MYIILYCLYREMYCIDIVAVRIYVNNDSNFLVKLTSVAYKLIQNSEFESI
jgi:hypothetical protein